MKSYVPLLVASGIIALVSAQVYPEITAEDVDEETRQIWCDQQTSVCPNLCQDQAHVNPRHNDCWWEDLHYECVCENGARPNLTEYYLTIPYNLCRASIQKCADNCGNNQECATICFSGRQCGAKDPRRVNSTSTTTTATSTATGTNKPSGTSDSGSDNNNGGLSDNNPLDINMASRFESGYGIGALVLAIAAGVVGML